MCRRPWCMFKELNNSLVLNVLLNRFKRSIARLFLFLMSFIILFNLTSCGSFKAPSVPIYKEKIILIKPDEELTKNCKVSDLTSSENLIKATLDELQRYYYSDVSTLLQDAIECNARLSLLRLQILEKIKNATNPSQ